MAYILKTALHVFCCRAGLLLQVLFIALGLRSFVSYANHITCTYTHRPACVHTHTHTNTHTHAHTHTYANTHTHIYTHTSAHTLRPSASYAHHTT